MKELQQRQRLKKRLYSTPVLCVLVILTLLIMRGAYLVMKKERESSRAVSALQARVAGLTERQSELRSDISRLETEEGIDAEIKERFSVSRPGEHVVVIVDQKVKPTSTEPVKAPWYKRWWEGVKNL